MSVNGHAQPIGAHPLVTMLEQLIVEVKAGRMTSIAVVAVNSSGGVATPYGGPQMAEMFTGTALLSGLILDQIRGPVAPRSPLLRVGQIPGL